MNEFVNLIQFLGQLTDPVGIATADGRVVSVNDATARLVGIAHAPETNFAEYLDSVDRDRLSRLCMLSTHPSAQEVGPIAIRVSVLYRSSTLELWVTATPLVGAEPDQERILLLFRRVVAENTTGNITTPTPLTPRHPNGQHDHQPLDDQHFTDVSAEWELLHEEHQDPMLLLTRSEQQVLRSTLDGQRVQTIAARLFMSEHTVRNTLKRVHRKLGVHSTAELRESLGEGAMVTREATTPAGIASFRAVRPANQLPTFDTRALDDSEPCSHSGTIETQWSTLDYRPKSSA
jgi:DNA-binding CsgD family transcriptional regulator